MKTSFNVITVLTLSFSAAIALSGCSPQDEVRVVKAEAEAAVAKAELARVKAEAEVALLNAKLTAIQAGLSPKDAAAAATIKPNNLEPVENSNERIVGDRSFTELPRFQPLLRLKQPATLADNVSLPPRLTEPKAVVNAPAPAAAAPAAAAPGLGHPGARAPRASDIVPTARRDHTHQPQLIAQAHVDTPTPRYPDTARHTSTHLPRRPAWIPPQVRHPHPERHVRRQLQPVSRPAPRCPRGRASSVTGTGRSTAAPSPGRRTRCRAGPCSSGAAAGTR